MIFAIYNLQTGYIGSRVECPPGQVLIQCRKGEDIYLNCPPDATHIIDVEPVTIVPPVIPPTTEELIMAITQAVQLHLDATARTHNYDNILSLASYAVSTDPVFATEGSAGAAWRDDCWRYCYQALAEVQAGTRTMPTPAEAVAELPQMVWPEPSI